MRTATRQRLERRRAVRALAVATVALAALTAWSFQLIGLGGGGRTARAVFASANGLKKGSEVRVAGVKIGEVESLDPGPRHTTTIKIAFSGDAPTIYRNATMRIRPRLMLEGNFVIDVNPGTRAAPELEGDSALPLSRTSVPVQLDQVLNVFDAPTRNSLHATIASIGRGLSGTPRGSTGLRGAVRELDGALDDLATSSRAMRGITPGDLPRTISTTAEFSGQLAADPQALGALVTNFRRFTGALAANDAALAASIRSLAGTLRTAPAGLTALDRALPPTRRLADALRPALQAAPGPLTQATRLLRQVRALSRPQELRGVVADLRPVTAKLGSLQRGLGKLTPLVADATKCLDTHVAWTFDQKLQDGANSTGDPAYLDLAHAFTGASAALGGFDGNGVGFRAGIAGGGRVVSGILPGLETVGGAGPTALGVRPAWLGYGKEPQYRPDQRCVDQPLPDLTARSGNPTRIAKAGR